MTNFSLKCVRYNRVFVNNRVRYNRVSLYLLRMAICRIKRHRIWEKIILLQKKKFSSKFVRLLVDLFANFFPTFPFFFLFFGFLNFYIITLSWNIFYTFSKMSASSVVSPNFNSIVDEHFKLFVLLHSWFCFQCLSRQKFEKKNCFSSNLVWSLFSGRT